MWYAAEDCSRSVQQRLENLGRCRLRVGYGNRHCRRQSLRRVPWKLAGDCTINPNKSPKIPYSAMAREVEQWSRICIRNQITTKSPSVLPTGWPNHDTKFQWNLLITFAVILLTEWQTDRQTERSHNHPMMELITSVASGLVSDMSSVSHTNIYATLRQAWSTVNLLQKHQSISFKLGVGTGIGLQCLCIGPFISTQLNSTRRRVELCR